MLEVLKFIFKLVISFIKMLFTIDVGDNLTLGHIMCVCFIFLPIFIIFFNYIKLKLRGDDL